MQLKRIEGKGFFISYAAAGSGPTGTETAIVHPNKKNGFGIEYWILNGDWTEEYERLVPKGYRACKKFFDSKKDEHGNFWSN